MPHAILMGSLWDVSPGNRVVVPEIVVSQPASNIEPLSRESHVEHERGAVHIGILIRRIVAEHFALGVPVPYRGVTSRVNDGPRRAEMIGLHVHQGLCASVAHQQGEVGDASKGESGDAVGNF